MQEGFLPFGVSGDPIDRITARMVMERHPTLEYLTTNAPGASDQIVSGIFPNDRWMSQAGIVVLKNPAVPKKVSAEFYIPPNAPARQVTLLLDGREVASHTYAGTGRLQADFRRAASGLHRRGPRGPDLHRSPRPPGARHGAPRRGVCPVRRTTGLFTGSACFGWLAGFPAAVLSAVFDTVPW